MTPSAEPTRAPEADRAPAAAPESGGEPASPILLPHRLARGPGRRVQADRARAPGGGAPPKRTGVWREGPFLLLPHRQRPRISKVAAHFPPTSGLPVNRLRPVPSPRRPSREPRRGALEGRRRRVIIVNAPAPPSSDRAPAAAFHRNYGQL